MTASRREVVAYMRVSTRQQDHQLQREAIEARALADNIKVTRWYVDDGVSGVKTRPQLNELDLAARRGEIGTVYVYALDRFGRNAWDLIERLTRLIAPPPQGYQVQVVSCADRIDLRDPMFALPFLSFAAVVADLERKRILERTRAGQDAARRRGVKFGGPRMVLSESQRERALELLEAGAVKSVVIEAIGRVRLGHKVRKRISRRKLEEFMREWRAEGLLTRDPMTNVPPQLRAGAARALALRDQRRKLPRPKQEQLAEAKLRTAEFEAALERAKEQQELLERRLHRRGGSSTLSGA